MQQGALRLHREAAQRRKAQPAQGAHSEGDREVQRPAEESRADVASSRGSRTTASSPGSRMSMREVYQVIDAVAPSTASVLILGESGTGKELCRAGGALKERSSQRPVLRAQLRRASQRDPRERAVRSREGRVHRLDQREAGRVRDVERRNDLPRRSRRDVAGHPGQAAARPRDADGAATRRQEGDLRSTSASSPRRTRICRKRSPTASCARISTTGSRSCRSTCRRCANASQDVQLLATEFLAAVRAARTASRSATSIRRRGNGSRRTTGRGTSAS